MSNLVREVKEGVDLSKVKLRYSQTSRKATEFLNKDKFSFEELGIDRLF